MSDECTALLPRRRARTRTRAAAGLLFLFFFFFLLVLLLLLGVHGAVGRRRRLLQPQLAPLPRLLLLLRHPQLRQARLPLAVRSTPISGGTAAS